jgi:MinD superfamily P-loop ATPase
VKQIVVISGKGGTGKTILTGAFAALAKDKVMADCDVDAADLHLLLSPEVRERNIFKSGVTAFIDEEACTGCGKCMEACRFQAINVSDKNGQKSYSIDPISCEGCAFCGLICPVNAIQMQENESGEWFVSDTRFGPMVHARLGVAEENSGKLVTLVRQKAKEQAESRGLGLVIVDGAPGIGCPVIASIAGVDCALVVTEPTLSGLHDARRVISVARHFGISAKLVINKYNLNEEMSKKIEEYCVQDKIPLIGKIGFDKNIVKAMVEAKTVIEYADSTSKQEIIAIWERLLKGIK